VSYIDQNQRAAGSAALMLQRVSKVLYPDDPDPHIRVAQRLGVKVGTFKSWLSGRRLLGRGAPVFGELEELLRQREQELQQVRIALHRWRSQEPLASS